MEYDWAGNFQFLMNNAVACNNEWWFGISGAVFFFTFAATMITCFSRKELPFNGKEFHGSDKTAPYIVFFPLRAIFIYSLGILMLSLILVSVITHWAGTFSLILFIGFIYFLGKFTLRKYSFKGVWFRGYRIGKIMGDPKQGCMIIALFFFLGPLLLVPLALIIAGPAAVLSDPYNAIELRFNPPVVVEGTLIERTLGDHASENIKVDISQARYLENGGLGKSVDLPAHKEFHGVRTFESDKLKPGDKVIFTEVRDEICSYVQINGKIIFKPPQPAENDEEKEGVWELIKMAAKAYF